jgi:tetratricopeptide (TPR) repeat protein
VTEFSRPEAVRANPLVQWIVKDMDNLTEIDRYGRMYIRARRWPEALFIYQHLASLALSRSSRAYAGSYLQIGKIFFLTGEREKAEKKWEIGLQIYQDHFPSELSRLRQDMESFKTEAAGSPRE